MPKKKKRYNELCYKILLFLSLKKKKPTQILGNQIKNSLSLVSYFSICIYAVNIFCLILL